jgi:hypothetical protein
MTAPPPVGRFHRRDQELAMCRGLGKEPDEARTFAGRAEQSLFFVRAATLSALGVSTVKCTPIVTRLSSPCRPFW